MKQFATAAIIFAVAFVAFGREIPDRLGPKIVDGSDALDGEYPYQVSLRVYFVHFCGGSILNDRWVLTAASCIVDKAAHEISVIAGTNLLSEAGQLYQAVLKISHPEYDYAKSINDVGLIRVSRTIVYTPKIQPISLPTENFHETGYSALFTGWGSTSIDGTFSEKLQTINLEIISQEYCVSFHNKVKDTQICTLSGIGKGACTGDVGGPLIAEQKQIGILSFVTPCARGYPDVYTRVWNFIKWIRTTINENSNVHLSIE